jgi:hypothetical protein
VAVAILVTGLVLFGLVIALFGVAMPLAVSLTDRGVGHAKPEDVALARALAPLMPGFVAVGLASVAAAVGVARATSWTLRLAILVGILVVVTVAGALVRASVGGL